MSDLSYTVRVMQKEDIPQALDVWRETGLQEGTHCLYTWLEVDPEGFNVAVTDSGEVIGICCGVVQHEDLAFVGIYAVREKYRGLGIGIKVWNACMEHIGSRNAALNAIPHKTELYRTKGGFPVVETRWTCVVNETNVSRVDHQVLSDEAPEGVDIQPFQESHLPSMYEYDLALMGYNRELALRLNCSEQDSRTLVAFKDGKCVGFGTIKISCHNAGQVGPLYADDAAVAEVMLRRLIVSLPQATGFAMMTVSSNPAANEFIKRMGCPTAEECPRLYKKKIIDVEFNKVFAHFDLNFSPY